MSKSILYATNTSSQTITGTETINFGTAIRKYGSNISVNGGNVVLSGSGYYSIDANVNFTASASGTVTVSIVADGVVVPGATASMLVAEGSVVSMTIPTIVRVFCCLPVDVTCVISGVNGTVNNASVVVEKE